MDVGLPVAWVGEVCALAGQAETCSCVRVFPCLVNVRCGRLGDGGAYFLGCSCDGWLSAVSRRLPFLVCMVSGSLGSSLYVVFYHTSAGYRPACHACHPCLCHIKVCKV